jgi:hypothetical protein
MYGYISLTTSLGLHLVTAYSYRIENLYMIVSVSARKVVLAIVYAVYHVCCKQSVEADWTATVAQREPLIRLKACLPVIVHIIYSATFARANQGSLHPTSHCVHQPRNFTTQPAARRQRTDPLISRTSAATLATSRYIYLSPEST